MVRIVGDDPEAAQDPASHFVRTSVFPSLLIIYTALLHMAGLLLSLQGPELMNQTFPWSLDPDP